MRKFIMKSALPFRPSSWLLDVALLPLHRLWVGYQEQKDSRHLLAETLTRIR